ncbi:MAG: diguanylate cyclase [Planctomycetota bacterium]|nr:MAG: diguanylate cyclase [Planctomycetota bacterium]
MPVLVINENGAVRIESIEKAVTRIGRDKTNDIYIDSMEISRFHCQIQLVDEGYLITDLNSRNGTLVNGSYVKGSLLEDGDMIHLGDVSLIFKMDKDSEKGSAHESSHGFKVIDEDQLKDLKIRALEREHLLKLHKISVHIASILDIDRLLDVAMDEVFDLTGAERGLVMLVDERNRLTLRGEKNMAYAKAPPQEQKLIKELIQRCLKERKMISIKESFEPSVGGGQIKKTLPLKRNTMIVIPLKTMAWKEKKKEVNERRKSTPLASKLVGILYLASRYEIQPFSSQDMDLIDAASHHIAVAVTNAKLHAMATMDKLTGLYNRGYFETLFIEEISKAKQTKTPLSLIITDIDHFKKFNDTHGHQIGDQVLHDVSQTIKRCLRVDDISARYGGEELVFILPKTNASQAQIVAEKIRKAVEKSKHTEKELSVTISLGVATYPDHGESMEIIIKRADQALYEAKHSGRNTFRIWSPDLETKGVSGRVDKLAGIISGDQAKNYQNLQLLLETISILNSNRDLDSLLESLLDKIIECTDADRALIFLADEYEMMSFTKGRNNKGQTLTQASMYSRSIPQQVFETGKSCCRIDDGTDGGMAPSQSMGRFQLQTVMCVPLQAHGERIGVLYVDSHIAKKEFGVKDVIFLEALANQVSTALQHARIMEKKLQEEKEKRKALEAELEKLKKR